MTDIPESHFQSIINQREEAVAKLAATNPVCDKCQQPVDAQEAIENDHMHRECLVDWCVDFVENNNG